MPFGAKTSHHCVCALLPAEQEVGCGHTDGRACSARELRAAAGPAEGGRTLEGEA